MMWDRGYWEPEGNKTPEEAIEKGDFKFTLKGNRLRGSFVLVRIRDDRNGGKRTNWMLIKHEDKFSAAQNGAGILDKHFKSVASGRTMEAIASGKGRKPKPFMMKSAGVGANAVWDSSQGLAADERNAGGRSKKTAAKAKSAMPAFIPPQLCQTLGHPPAAKGWIHEIKFDGYRVQMRVENGNVTLKTRKGLDW